MLLGLAAFISALAYLYYWDDRGGPRSENVYRLPIDGPGWELTGPWEAGLLGFDRVLFSGQAGARAELEFDGSAIDLELLAGPGGGFARVWIDGSDARADLAPKTPDGVARIDLYAPDGGFAAVPIASGLPSGQHRLALEVVGAGRSDSSGELVMLRAAIAGEPAPRWPVWAGLTAALAGVALVILASLNWWTARLRWRPVIERMRLDDAPALLVAAVLLTLTATVPASGFADPLFWIRIAALAVLGIAGILAPTALAVVTAAGWLLAPVAAPLGPLQLNPGELGLAALTGAWGVRAALLGRLEFGITRRHLPLILLFLGAALASTAAAEYSKVAVRGLRLVVAEPLWLGCLLATYVRGERRILLAGAVLAAAAAAAALALLAGASEVLTGATPGRLRGPWGSPNGLALVLERGLPLALGAVLAARAWSHRSGAGAVVLIVGAALAATFSRGGLLAAAVGSAGMAQAGRGSRFPGRWLAPSVGLLVLTGLVALALAGIGAETLETRLRLWGSAALMAGDHFWLGVGLDNFLYQLPDYLDPQLWREPNLSHPHNLLLDAWLSLGVLGLAVMALLLVRAASALAVAPAGRGNALGWADAGMLAAMGAALSHGLLDNFYFQPELAAFFWLFFAYSLAAGSDHRPGVDGIEAGDAGLRERGRPQYPT